MNNFFENVRQKNSRLWAIIVFFPFLFATIVLCPISILIDFILDLPRILRNFFDDLRVSVYWSIKHHIELMCCVWVKWWKSL